MPITSPVMIDESDISVQLTAKWISPLEKKTNNYTFLARKEFIVNKIPGSSVLHIAADTRYVVYLNGQLIGAGPIRGTHKRYFFDSFDISSFISEGKNYLAAEVYCPVKPVNISAPPVTPALFAQITPFVETDASWEVIADPSRNTEALFYTHHIGYSEFRDLRKELVGWQIFQDNAKDWKNPEEVGSVDSLGGRILTPRNILSLTSDAYKPVRIVETGAVPPTPFNEIKSNLDYADLMQHEVHFEPSFQRVKNANALTRGGIASIFPSDSNDGAYIIMDFEREICGNLIIDIEAPGGTIIDIGYDESVVNGRLSTKLINPNGSIYRFADRCILRSGRQKVEINMHDRGLRVLQIVMRCFSNPIKIYSIKMINRIYPIPIEASFECNQPFLNRLWEMCCSTMSACCTDSFTDCPWREQTFWLNDQLVENLYYLTMTSDKLFPRRNFLIGADGALPDGLIPARYPSTKDTLFPSMSAIWTIALSDYYMYTGDVEFLDEMLPVMDKALSVYDVWRNKNGLIIVPEGMWNFIDWGYDSAGVTLDNNTAVLNILIAGAYKRAASLHKATGNTELAKELQYKSHRSVLAIQQYFWNRKERRFNDFVAPFTGHQTFSQHAHALGLDFGLFDSLLQQDLLDALTHPDAIQAELYFQHFVLNSLALTGRTSQALKIIRKLWGEMVNVNSPTIWETQNGRSSISGCGSLCHGFSCGPMYFMQTAILGIKPLKPGFEEFKFNPQSLGLLWAKGHVPTPHGKIYVEWVVKDNTLRASIEIPKKTSAVLVDGKKLKSGIHKLKY